MSDYIDRQAAINALCKVWCGSGYCGISCDDVKAIEQLPSVGVEPVIHCIDYITDEIAKKIIEEANKACSNCQEWVCDECEYRHWRNRG